MFKRLYPLFETEGAIGAVSEESTSVEGTESAPVQAQEEQTPPAEETTPDVTKQESFAKRLKEQTEKELAKARSEWEREAAEKAQAARDAAIAELGHTFPDGRPVRTEAELKQAREEERLWAQYEQRGYDNEIIQELVEGKKFREQYQQTQQTLEQQQRAQEDYQAFLSSYPDVDPKDIPQNVWAEVNAGKSLVDAYARHENQILKRKLAEVEKKQQIEQQNQENAASSTGSVTGQGDSKATHFTREQVQQMSQAEVDKNYDAIVASMKKW